MCARLSVRGCCVSLGCAKLSSYDYLFHLKSTSTAAMPPLPNVYGSASRWRCTLKNWLSLTFDAICTEQNPAPAIIGNHYARVLGTTITALASHLFTCADITPTEDGCGK